MLLVASRLNALTTRTDANGERNLSFRIFDPTQSQNDQSQTEPSPLSPAASFHPRTDGMERPTETKATSPAAISETLLDLHQQALDAILKLTEATAARIQSLDSKGST